MIVSGAFYLEMVLRFIKGKEGDTGMVELAKLLSKIGYINEHGDRICGTAAFLHYLRLFDYWDKNGYDPKLIERGRIFVERALGCHGDKISKRMKELCA